MSVRIGHGRIEMIASLVSAGPSALAALAALPATVGSLELRADLAGEIAPDTLRQRFAGRLIYSWRDAAPLADRHRRILAARAFDFVELDCERDLVPDILSAIEPARRIIAWHGPQANVATLDRHFATMVAVPASLYRLVPRAIGWAGVCAPLHFLQALGRRDVLAFADGPAGIWTRLIAPRLGAPFLVGGVEGSAEQSSMQRLIEDFGLPGLSPVATICGIVGGNVQRSLSPRLHNAAYRRDGRAALFLPFADAGPDDVATGAEDLRRLGFTLGGLTVAAPYKEAALALADRCSAAARAAGAANLLVRHAGAWHADTTDPAGILEALAAHGATPAGCAAAVLGCGGAGRAVAAALDAAGARVTLVNRSRARGTAVASGLGVSFLSLAAFDPAEFGLVVNATPLGADGVGQPFDVMRLRDDAVLVDLVYAAAATPLVEAARARGLGCIDGIEILHRQVRHQYRRMAGLDRLVNSGRPGAMRSMALIGE